MTLGVLLVGALFLVACGEEGGDTTVIREEQTGEAEEAAAEAQEQVEQLEAKLEKQQQQAKKQQQTVAASEPEPEPESEPAAPAPSAAPDVVGQRLDVAKAELRSAGYSARVSGGGVFGIVVDRNWVVCAQEPPSGDRVDINVDRSC
jgi:hypothetical protein